ncbi:MAG: division/cell wall cluster transcriptional repressor MraZ [Ruminococcus sp.]|nr:division/cell wall cluster transcriptional repressor MraZ [Ruminococcus sp.]
MFTGMTYQSLDAKGRVTLSQKFRDELGESFYVTSGFDKDFKCVQIMSAKQFDRLLSQIRELPARTALRLQYILISPATEVSANAQGRVQIPQALRDNANLKKDIVVLGMDTRVEVWDKDVYDEFMNKQMQESFDDALELLRL